MCIRDRSTIDEMDGIETDWGQKMNQYVSQFSISDFAFPSDLQSAGALVSGIFQDIWYAFGDYKILFVFPLTLAPVSYTHLDVYKRQD